MRIFKISYVVWNGDKLYIGGKDNTKSKQVVGKTHLEAVAKLRHTMSEAGVDLEVVGIEDCGSLDIL